MYNILIAEDDRDIANLLKLYFEGEGYRVYCARDGNEALNLASCKNIHIAALDIMMPKLDGFEVTKRLRATSSIPIVIISAKDIDRDKILVYLMKSLGRIFTKEQIWEHINGVYFESDESVVRVHMSRLRKKIEEDPQNPIYIKTIRGLGYKIDKIKD